MKKIMGVILALLLTSCAHEQKLNIDFINKTTSLKEIKAQLGSNYQLVFEQNYMVDAGALEVKSGDETLFVLLTDPALAPNDDATFSTLVVESPQIQTAEGIGVGTLISDAVKVYGPVELSFNPENESREFAVFAHGPQNILFRTGSENEAGIYPKGQYTTKEYKPDAKIKWMIVQLQ